MLDFYESKTGFEDPSKADRRLGGLDMDAVGDLDQLKITNSSDFNELHFFEDQFFEPANVRERLAWAIDRYSEAKETPGYMNPGVEKYISLLEAAVAKDTGIQTYCD